MERKVVTISLSGDDAKLFNDYHKKNVGTVSEVGRKLLINGIKMEDEKHAQVVEKLIKLEDNYESIELLLLSLISGIGSMKASVIKMDANENKEQFEKRYLSTYKNEMQKMLRGARAIKDGLEKGSLEKP